MQKEQVTDQMADVAITWFARLRADDVTADDRENFLAWLRLDRCHQMAFVEILNLWEDMSVVRLLEFDELQPFPLLQGRIWNDKEQAKA